MCEKCVTLGSKTFKLGEKYTAEIGGGEISDYGRSRVERHISNAQVDRDCDSVALPPLPDDFQWIWQARRGNFPKRVSSYYYKTYGLKLHPVTLACIGSIASDHTSKNQSYTYELVDTFDWIAGDYGDKGSCYWSNHAGARKMLDENGAYAIRFYYGDGDSGCGRAWVVTEPVGENTAILWNGYGYQTRDIARVLAFVTGLTYKKIELRNNGAGYGELYINDCSGYAIGTEEALKSVESYDFQWNDIDIDADEDEETCNNCGTVVTEYDSYTSPDGDTMCSDCYHESYESCERCGNDREREEMNRVESGDYDWVCDYCLERHYTSCADCGDYYHDDDVTTVQDGDKVCSNCLENDYSYCDHCDEYVKSSDMSCTDDGHHDLCDDCKLEHCGDCETCGECFMRDDMVKIGDVYYCEYNDCADEAEALEEKKTGDITNSFLASVVRAPIYRYRVLPCWRRLRLYKSANPVSVYAGRLL